MKGCEIDLLDNQTFRVWTSQKKKALQYAKTYNLRVSEYDREADLYVPATLADNILPCFGAKIRRKASPAAIEALKLARANIIKNPLLESPKPQQ